MREITVQFKIIVNDSIKKRSLLKWLRSELKQTAVKLDARNITIEKDIRITNRNK